MAFSISPIASKDGNAATITGGVDFVDTSGTGVGPWIIAKSTIDPAGVNVQFVLANNAAKCDVSSINGTTTPTGHGTAATCMRVELPSDGTGLVNAAQSGTWNVGQSGTWTVQQGTPPWSVSQSGNWTARIVGNAGGIMDAAGQNASAPANELLVAGQFNTSPTAITSGNVSPLQLDGNGNLRVNLNANSFGTITVAGTVTANAGTNLNTSALALDTSVNGILVTQGSTTSGEKGPLIQGAVTTSAPSYTTAQTSPLSLDTAGNLRVTGSFSAGLPSDRTATGTVTAVNNTVSVNTQGCGDVGIIVTADTNITLAFEGSVDGTNWVAVNAYPLGGGASVTTTAANGSWTVPCAGLNQFRMRVTVAGATPTATISLEAGAGSTQPNLVVSPTAANFNVTVTGTVAATQSGTWTVQQGTPPWTVNPGTPGNWGIGATGSAVPANAVYKAGLAKTALPTAGTDGNLTGAMMDKFGRQVVLAATIRDLTGTQTTTISASTTETTIVTAAASVFNDLVMLIVSNTSTATNTRIDFRDTTAGTILFSLQSNGGQPPVGFALPVPIPQTTVNTNWTAQCATSTTDIRVYAVFAKNK